MLDLVSEIYFLHETRFMEDGLCCCRLGSVCGGHKDLQCGDDRGACYWQAHTRMRTIKKCATPGSLNGNLSHIPVIHVFPSIQKS